MLAPLLIVGLVFNSTHIHSRVEDEACSGFEFKNTTLWHDPCRSDVTYASTVIETSDWKRVVLSAERPARFSVSCHDGTASGGYQMQGGCDAPFVYPLFSNGSSARHLFWPRYADGGNKTFSLALLSEFKGNDKVYFRLEQRIPRANFSGRLTYAVSHEKFIARTLTTSARVARRNLVDAIKPYFNLTFSGGSITRREAWPKENFFIAPFIIGLKPNPTGDTFGTVTLSGNVPRAELLVSVETLAPGNLDKPECNWIYENHFDVLADDITSHTGTLTANANTNYSMYERTSGEWDVLTFEALPSDFGVHDYNCFQPASLAYIKYTFSFIVDGLRTVDASLIALGDSEIEETCDFRSQTSFRNSTVLHRHNQLPCGGGISVVKEPTLRELIVCPKGTQGDLAVLETTLRASVPYQLAFTKYDAPPDIYIPEKFSQLAAAAKVNVEEGMNRVAIPRGITKIRQLVPKTGTFAMLGSSNLGKMRCRYCVKSVAFDPKPNAPKKSQTNPVLYATYNANDRGFYEKRMDTTPGIPFSYYFYDVNDRYMLGDVDLVGIFSSGRIRITMSTRVAGKGAEHGCPDVFERRVDWDPAHFLSTSTGSVLVDGSWTSYTRYSGIVPPDRLRYRVAGGDIGLKDDELACVVDQAQVRMTIRVATSDPVSPYEEGLCESRKFEVFTKF